MRGIWLVLAVIIVSGCDRVRDSSVASWLPQNDAASHHPESARHPERSEGSLFAASDDDVSTQNFCSEGLESFKTNVHPFLRQRCVRCHSNAGPGPAHSVADPQTSYERVLAYQNFEHIKQSWFVQHGGNKAHCTRPTFECQTSPEEIEGIVTKWWEGGQKQCPRGLPYVSAQQVMPQLPPRGPKFAAMRFDMKNVDPQFEGLYAEIEIQKLSDKDEDHPGAYLVQRPRFFSKKGHWRVRHLRVLINGQMQKAGDIFKDVDLRINEDATTPVEDRIWPAPVASTRTLILIEDTPGADTISLAFGEVTKTASAVTCHHQDVFVNVLKPIMQYRGCYFCHGGDPDSDDVDLVAQKRWNTAGTDEQTCAGAAMQSQAFNSLMAPLVWFPTHGDSARSVHPLVLTNPSDVIPSWTDWIESRN